MTVVTVTGAARLARVSRGTIYNKVESGELSKGPEGIDTAELLRVFGTLHDVDSHDKHAKKTSSDNDSDVVSSVMARQNDEFTKKLIEQLEEAREDKEWLRELAEQRDQQAQQAQTKLNETIEEHARERQTWTQKLDDMQKLLPAPDVVMPRKKFLGIF